MIALAESGGDLIPDSDVLRDLFLNNYKPKRLRATTKENARLFLVTFRRFGRYLAALPAGARPADTTPRASHLTYDHVNGFADWLVDEQELAPATANCYLSKLLALWDFLARERIVDKFPTVARLPEPERIPRAWQKEQLRRLFDSCSAVTYVMGSAPGSLWWHSLHSVLWDSGERIGAVLKITWDDLDFDTGHVLSRAENRKGRRKDMLFPLHPDTVLVLMELRKYATGDRIFELKCHMQTLYNRYERILRNAELPTDRKSKFHRIRKSVASWAEAAGYDSSRMLGHESRRTTEKSYHDPTIVKRPSPSSILFRPGTL